MRILNSYKNCRVDLQGAVLAIGNFDGVHRGHQAVIAGAKQAALGSGKPCGVMTFEPHPRKFFRPEIPLFRLTPAPLKLKLIELLGADLASVLTFDAALAALTAEDFARRVLAEGLRTSHVVTGDDFHFGKGREGNPKLLVALGAELGFGVSVVAPVGEGAQAFSSSRIRDLLSQGKPRQAADMLGYWWRFAGEVIGGAKRGLGLGFPTANIAPDVGMDLKHGIYAVRVMVGGGRHPGAAYLGTRPTFGAGAAAVEVFLFDFARDLYGQHIEVEIVEFLRGDRSFASQDALKVQMKQDCAQARAILDAIGTDDPMRVYPLGRALAAD